MIELSEALGIALRFTLPSLEPELVDALVEGVIASAEQGEASTPEDMRTVLRDWLPQDCLIEGGEEEDDLVDDMCRAVGRVFLPKGEVDGEERGGADGEDDEISEDDLAAIGACLLCERPMPLTKHHLYPRMTHKRLCRKAAFADKDLSVTINICRPCHSCVHRTHDEMALALSFASADLLRADPSIQKFTSWAARQRMTSKSDAVNPNLHYRR